MGPARRLPRSPGPPAASAGVLACLLAAGCAALTPPRGAGVRPGAVGGVLTSAVERRPYTPVELGLPEVRAAVARCETAGREHCRDRVVARDRRTSFTRGTDREVVALLTIGEQGPGAALDIACRFLDPAGAVAATVRIDAVIPLDAPRGVALTFPCAMALDSSAPAGLWSLELVVDGREAALLPFSVVDRSPARGTRSGARRPSAGGRARPR